MQLGMIKHGSPAGVGAAVPLRRVQGPGMGGVMDDVQGYVSGVMQSPDAFKYMMYAVGGLFLFYALNSGGRR